MPATTEHEQEVPVLVVGGSLVGLSAALFLRWHGVGVLAVERHTGTAIRPRSGHLQLRTLELLRSVGLEDVVRRKGEEQYARMAGSTTSNPWPAGRSRTTFPTSTRA
jgi:2-polyprenyl-6-methoxyphenol hydroxylase-like FAD-dependent oxidoreductase